MPNIGTKQDIYHQNHPGIDKEKELHQNVRISPPGQQMAYINPQYPQKKLSAQNQYANAPSHQISPNYPHGMIPKPKPNEMHQGHQIPINEYQIKNSANLPPYLPKGVSEKGIYQNAPHIQNPGIQNINEGLYAQGVPNQGFPLPPYQNDLNLQRHQSDDQKQLFSNKNPNVFIY